MTAQFARPFFLLLAGLSRAGAGTPHWDLEGAPRVGESVYSLGKVAFKSFEISGIALSRTRTDLFWGIQDEGANLVFAFYSSGQLLQTVEISGLSSEDLEDISADQDGSLYLADTGTNLRARDEVSVYRLREPRPGESVAEIGRRWRLRWPEAGRDCESLVVHGGYGWLVAKIRDDGQRSTLARFSLADTNEIIELEVLGDLDVPTPAAAADLTPDGDQFAISTRAGTYSWQVGGDVASAVGRAPVFSSSTPDTKKEGLAFVPQGLLVATESRDLYLDITPMVIPKTLEPRLEVQRGPLGPEISLSASYGVACALDYRPRLDQGEWAVVAADFPGLGIHVKWKGEVPLWPDAGGYLRLVASP